MAPKSRLGRFAAACYLIACALIAAYAIAGREIRDTDIFVAYALLLLSFPAGYVVAALFGAIAYALYNLFGVIVPGGLANNLGDIALFGGVGYAQWFILLPWLYRRFNVPSNNALETDREA